MLTVLVTFSSSVTVIHFVMGDVLPESDWVKAITFYPIMLWGFELFKHEILVYTPVYLVIVLYTSLPFVCLAVPTNPFGYISLGFPTYVSVGFR